MVCSARLAFGSEEDVLREVVVGGAKEGLGGG